MIELVEATGLDMIVVHVDDEATIPSFNDQMQHETEAYTNEFFARFLPGAPHARLELRIGPAVDEILAATEAAGAELLAVGWPEANTANEGPSAPRAAPGAATSRCSSSPPPRPARQGPPAGRAGERRPPLRSRRGRARGCSCDRPRRRVGAAVRSREAAVHGDMLVDHAFSREVLFGVAAAGGTIDRVRALHGLDHLVDRIAQQSAHAVLDDLGRRAVAEGNDRSAASERLDHHHPERLRPADRVEQRDRVGEETVSGVYPDFADVLDVAAEEWRHRSLKYRARAARASWRQCGAAPRRARATSIATWTPLLGCTCAPGRQSTRPRPTPAART